MTIPEAELQARVLKLIREARLADTIEPSEEIRRLCKLSDENVFPSFSIDHLSRVRCAEAAGHALESLNYLEELTADLNVSVSTGEILRPDIVCFNPESETLVIFELKKSNQTGRQALTELLAYEQEVKNLLPFLSNYDTVFVLISTVWSTLLDHGVASAVTWSGKTLLCLDVALLGDSLTFKPYLPKSWYITGSRYFPKQSLPTITVCLYDYLPLGKEDGLEDGNIDPRLITAVDLIAREGDRIGGHGFVILWRDHSSTSQTEFNLTVGGVSPFAFYQAMRERGYIKDDQGRLVEPLDKILFEHNPGGHSAALFKAIDAAKPVLSEFSSPTYEGLLDWESEFAILKQRAEPIWCDFWGLPGVYVRRFVTDAAVRKHKKGWLGNNDWRVPRIGISLLTSMLRPDALADGNVRCSDCFKIGASIGLDLTLRKVLAQDPGALAEVVHCILRWNFYDLASILEEVRMLANAAKNVEPPKVGLVISEDLTADMIKTGDAILYWLGTSFLGGAQPFLDFMEIGVNGAILFDGEVKELFGPENCAQAINAIAPKLRNAFVNMLKYVKELESEGSLSSRWETDRRTLLQILAIDEGATEIAFTDAILVKSVPDLLVAWPLLLTLADACVPAVFHEHNPIAPADPDWAWLRQGIEEMRERGIGFAAVHLEANGVLGVGAITDPIYRIMGDVSDPTTQVLFFDHSHGIGDLKKTSWEDLESGKHFAVIKTAKAGK